MYEYMSQNTIKKQIELFTDTRTLVSRFIFIQNNLNGVNRLCYNWFFYIVHRHVHTFILFHCYLFKLKEVFLYLKSSSGDILEAFKFRLRYNSEGDKAYESIPEPPEVKINAMKLLEVFRSLGEIEKLGNDTKAALRITYNEGKFLNKTLTISIIPQKEYFMEMNTHKM